MIAHYFHCITLCLKSQYLCQVIVQSRKFYTVNTTIPRSKAGLSKKSPVVAKSEYIVGAPILVGAFPLPEACLGDSHDMSLLGVDHCERTMTVRLQHVNTMS